MNAKQFRQRTTHISDTCWRVEWVSKLAFYPDSTDVDHDRCASSYQYFPAYAEALEFAVGVWKSVASKTSGIVELDEMRFEREYDDEPPQWVPIGETKIVSDDSGIPEN